MKGSTMLKVLMKTNGKLFIRSDLGTMMFTTKGTIRMAQMLKAIAALNPRFMGLWHCG
jgi:hypothetical protein